MATATQSIREIVASQPSAAAILRRFDIDVCAHASKSLRDACADKQLSVEQVLEKLEDEAAIDAGAEHANPAEFSPSRLIQHIVRVHHHKVRREMPRLVELARVVAEKHVERAPEVKSVELLVAELNDELQEHISKEECVLFPYIAQVDQTPLLAFRPPYACFSRVGQPIFAMVQEHECVKLLLAELRQLTDNFTPPAWGCSMFVDIYSSLRAFAGSLDEHMRLEEEVLFPRAIAMETKLMSGGVQ